MHQTDDALLMMPKFVSKKTCPENQFRKGEYFFIFSLFLHNLFTTITILPYFVPLSTIQVMHFVI